MADNWKLVPIEPTVEMLAALDDRTPYAVRRSPDESCFEIVFNPSEEGRVAVSDKIQTVFQGTESEAFENYERLRRMWIYRAMLAAAPEKASGEPVKSVKDGINGDRRRAPAGSLLPELNEKSQVRMQCHGLKLLHRKD